MRSLLLTFLLALPGSSATAQHPHSGHSGRDPAGPARPYTGFETRRIKSLSATDVAQLEAGNGWGLALSGELNGYPGPAHLLELKKPLGLSTEQVSLIEIMHAQMQSEAIVAGRRFMAAEQALDAGFQRGDLAPEELKTLIDESASTRADLRFVHLKYHLRTLPHLSAQQVTRYNQLRGYGGH